MQLLIDNYIGISGSMFIMEHYMPIRLKVRCKLLLYYSSVLVLIQFHLLVLPSAHRATGNGIAVSFNRIMVSRDIL